MQPNAVRHIPDWSSPARWIAPDLPAAPAAGAPEKMALLDPDIKVVRFQITDSGKWDLCYLPSSGIIRVSRKTIEVVWAASCAYYQVYKRVFEDTPEGVAAVLDFEADSELSRAMDLLLWAFNDWVDGTDTFWPVGLPQPVEMIRSDSLEQHATQLALITFSYLFHHELSHHRLKHAESLPDYEREADREAAKWLLDGLVETDYRFIFRTWGIGTALALITARSIHTGQFTSSTHPRSFDRLYNTLTEFVSLGHHPGWSMALAIVHLHMASSGIGTPQHPSFGDARDALNACIDRLADWDNRRTAVRRI